MKIVHICLGGGWYEKNSYQDQLLPHYHRSLGYEVTVIASQNGRWNLDKGCYDKDTIPVRYLEDGIKLVRLRPALPLFLNTHVHLFYGMMKALNQEKPDIIFAHAIEILNYYDLPVYKKHHPSVKIVCDNHGDSLNSLHHWTSRLRAKWLGKGIIVKRLIPVVEWFYGTTPSRCDFLTKIYGVPKEKVQLLVMGADDDNMHIEQRDDIRMQVRDEFGIKPNDFLIVTGGRFNKSKGGRIVELLKAVGDIDNENLKLLVFGPVSDDIKPIFDKYANDRIHFIGGIPSDKVYYYFYAADLVAFPGLHSVMWEQAVASKVPCLFKKIDGFQHVDYDGNCILMEEDTANYYKTVISSILGDSDLYKKMINKANSNESTQFLYSNIAQKVINDVIIKCDDKTCSDKFCY